jgi:Zn2+/Cd2+-exporting ATPase
MATKDLTCADALPDRAAEGVVSAGVDVGRGVVDLEYDPARLAPAEAEAVLTRLAADVAAPIASCTVHVQPFEGRSCESCALTLERRLQALPGVRGARATLRGGVLRVVYDRRVTSTETISRAVREIGLDAPASRAPGIGPAGALAGGPATRVRAWIADARREAAFVGLALAGMLTGLVATWLGAPPGVAWAGWAVSYAFGGWFGLLAGIESLRHRAVDIDLLMVLAALGALAIGAPFEGAMLLFLFSLSNVLQKVAIGRSRRAIEALMELRPDSASVRRGDGWEDTPLDQIALDDRYLVRPGDRLPLDGEVVAGRSAVDQASLTGESVPAEKGPGSTVFAGTINLAGSLEVRVTRLAGESALARMIALVEEAQARKAETQRFIDRYEQPYALGVIGLTVAAMALPPLVMGEVFASSFYRAMTIMVAASPCALVISTPAAVLSAIGNAARRGILFKGGVYVEEAANVRAVAFDKTGTLTEGLTRMTDIVALGALSEDEVLAVAAGAQARSEHHLAKATLEEARQRGLAVPDAEEFRALVGRGVRARVGGSMVHVGNPRYFEEIGEARLARGCTALTRLEEEGKTSVLVARQRGERLEALGAMAFADTLRPGAAEMVRRLRSLGIERVIMLTGDNRAVAERIGREAGVDEVHSELMPEDKVEVLRRLEHEVGPTAMVGDGVNDAPALAAATIGIAMGAAGTDVALETADVVLMSDDLDQIAYAIALSRSTRRTLMANLGFAVGIILVMVGSILTVGLPLPLAVVGHEGSTVLVSLNGLRLLGFRGP